jgi:hypothetical protein
VRHTFASPQTKGNDDASFSLVFGQNTQTWAIDGAGHERRKEMLVSKEGNLVTLSNVFETTPKPQQALLDQWTRFDF